MNHLDDAVSTAVAILAVTYLFGVTMGMSFAALT
jgi:hypothetical protein